DIKGTLSHNGEIIKEGQSTEVLGHPAKAVKWLAEVLSGRSRTLNAGLFVSAGTFNIPVELEAGKYTVEYENIGKVEFEVTEEEIVLCILSYFMKINHEGIKITKTVQLSAL